MPIKYPTPLADRVIILPDAEQKTNTPTGAFEVPDALKERSLNGTVKAVGIGAYAKDTGVLIPMELRKENKVVYGSRSGELITLDGVDHLLMRESDVKFKL